VSLDDRLVEIEAQSAAIQAQLARPEVHADPAALKRYGRELARLEPVVSVCGQLRATRAELDGAREVRDQEADPEMREMAREEIASLEADEARLLEELKVLLLPRDPNDDKDVIIEIRAGAGGEEAALFAAELFRMYVRYADRHRFSVEALSLNETGIGGMREAIFEVHGDGAYSRLKFEGGVHRVQRVPETESGGRIHTSTATVAVLPEADEVDVEIGPNDVRIDVFRATGPGGQSVNTTDSAVRLTHLPTGMVVSCQDEKSQLQNRIKAMAILRARLYQAEQERLASERSETRRSQVGTGERSEKIRTYNYPQNRVTDHRIGKTIYNLPAVLNGDLDEFIDELTTTQQAERLQAIDDEG
jgi:peptide chain release factor 1